MEWPPWFSGSPCTVIAYGTVILELVLPRFFLSVGALFFLLVLDFSVAIEITLLRYQSFFRIHWL